MCSLENGLWLLRYAGRPTPKNDKKMEQKNGHKRKILTPQIKKGNAEREREIEYCSYYTIFSFIHWLCFAYSIFVLLLFQALAPRSIVTLDSEYQDIIGTAETLSFRDIMLANLQYECPPSEQFIDQNCGNSLDVMLTWYYVCMIILIIQSSIVCMN